MSVPNKTTNRTFLFSPVYGIVITVISLMLVLVVIVMLFWQNGSSDSWLSQLSKVDFARGIITLFVVLVTVLIAGALVVYALFLGNGNHADDKVTWLDRISKSKDVLTIFIGLLGTVMGFYYAENRVSPDNVKEIASSIQGPATSTVNDIEKKGFDALIANDFDAASKAFAEAYKLSPRWHNVDEINKLLLSQKDAYTAAAATKDKSKTDAFWAALLCDIYTKNFVIGMSTDMISKIKKNCPPPPANTQMEALPANSGATNVVNSSSNTPGNR